MNRVTLVGRLTKDPELEFMQGIGDAVTTFTIAIDRYNSRTVEKLTDFVSVVVKGKQAETIAEKMRKGEKIAVEGKLQTRSYTTENNQKRYVIEVIAMQVEFISNMITKDSSENDKEIDFENDVDYSGTPFDFE